MGNTISINSSNSSVDSDNKSTLKASICTVPVALTGYMDTTGFIKHSGSNTITVSGSELEAKQATSEEALSPLRISAVNNTSIDNSGINVMVEGIGGGRLILEAEDASTATINLGDAINNNKFKAANILVNALNNPHVKNEATAPQVGTLVGSGTIITSRASGGANLNVEDRNTLSLIHI